MEQHLFRGGSEADFEDPDWWSTVTPSEIDSDSDSGDEWGYDSEDLEKAIVVIREDVSKRQNGGYYGDSSYYDPDTSTEFHIGKSSADTVIRPNTKGLRRCSEEPVDNDAGDKFQVIVTRDFISVTRKDTRGSGWGQDLRLLCKTRGSFHRDDWNEPHSDVSRHIFTTWYVVFER